MRFTKEAQLGAAAAQTQTPQRGSGAGGADAGLGSGSQGIPLPVMWGGAGSAAARQMLAGLGLAGLGLSRPGAWGPGLDLGQMAQHGAEARAPDMHFAWMQRALFRSISLATPFWFVRCGTKIVHAEDHAQCHVGVHCCEVRWIMCKVYAVSGASGAQSDQALSAVASEHLL